MCMSTVYRVKGDSQEKIAEYVSKVVADGNVYTFTDVMGSETQVTGKLKSMDFVKNIILIEE